MDLSVFFGKERQTDKRFGRILFGGSHNLTKKTSNNIKRRIEAFSLTSLYRSSIMIQPAREKT